MIIGTAGHIDHGKSTLVRALTGVDTDRLKEEKARGISIELGYAYLPSPDGQVLGFIDVPGHEKLVHTMVAGACGIDFGLLVVAADDGVMPQTREHLAILELVGVTRGAVALTKVDRVDAARAEAVSAEIAALLADSALRGSPVFPLNAVRPDEAGTQRLRDYLLACARDMDAMPARRRLGLFRLAVDRVFTLAGHGTVVTGTVFSGTVRPQRDADALVLMPAGTPLRLRSLHAQNRAATEGVAGQRCALNLPGIETRAIERGDWIADPRAFLPTRHIDADLRLLPDADGVLKAWSPLHIHWGAAHRLAHVVPLSADTIAPGEQGRVQLVFDRPVCAAAGDRYIARNAQASRTVGGGIVLDPNAPARKRRGAQRQAWLDAIAAMLRHDEPAALLAQAPLGLEGGTLVRLAGVPFERLALPAEALRVSGKGADALPTVIMPEHWAALREHALATLGQFHVQAPDEPGLDASRLRRMAFPALPDALLHALLAQMTRDGDAVRNGPWLHLPGHAMALDGPESILSEQVLPQLLAAGFNPPWVRDLARTTAQPEDRIRSLLRKEMRRGQVCQVVHDLYFHREQIRQLALRLSALAAANGGAEAAAFRDAIGVGRKRAVQILEFFDRVGYTRRLRGMHIPRPDTHWRD